MADTKISNLSAITMPPTMTDVIPVVDSPGVSQKKMTLTQLVSLAQPFNVMAYGATGDGSTDDTAAVHAARDAAGTNGTVYFPPGVYNGLTYAANVNGQTWVFAKGATLQEKSAGNSDLLQVSGTDCLITGSGTLDHRKSLQTSGTALVVSGARSVIRGLTITNSKHNGMTVTGATRVEVDDVTISNPGDNGIAYIDDATYGYVHGCVITGMPTSGGFHCIMAHGNSATKSIDGFRAVDNYCEVASGSGIEVGPFSGKTPSLNVLLANNTIVAAAAAHGGISLDTCTGTTVTDNSYSDGGFTCDVAFIELADCNECTVSGNSSRSSKTLKGISVDRSNRCTITGNILHGWDFASTGYGMHIAVSAAGSQTASDNVVANNSFIADTSNTQHAIFVQANDASAQVNRNLLLGNTCIGTGSAKAIKLEVDAGQIDGTVIRGNNCQNWGTIVIDINSLTGSGVSTNTDMGDNRGVTDSPALMGDARAPLGSFTTPTNWDFRVHERLTLAGATRATVAGTGRIILSDDVKTRSRLVLAGRGG